MTAMRVATGDDLPALARVFVAAWHGGYHGIVPDDVIDSIDEPAAADLLAPQLTAPDRVTLVAVGPGGEIVAFATYGPDRDTPPDGYLASLYVAPEAAGHGVGRGLLDAAIAAMPGVDVTLWVFAGNARARALYERAGFIPDGAELTDPQWRTPQVRYRRPAG